MNPRYHRYRPHISRVARRAARFVWYGAAAVLVLLAVLYTVARLMLPQLAERKAEIEQYLSAKSDHTVRIEILSTFWDGLYPGVFIEGLRIYAGDNRRPAVRLAEVRISLALLPLLWGRLEVHRLVLTEPTLTVERLSDGRFRVSGFDPMPVAEDSADEKFINWLLSPNEFIIQRGQVRWVDQKSKEPPLLLSQIEAHLKNSGERHRLGITARFPAAVCRECALVLDIRGNPLAEPDWNGEIYVRAADLDLDALPFIVRERLPRGVHGKLNARLWTQWDGGKPDAVRGQLAGSAVIIPWKRLKAPLKVRQASGDVHWRTKADGWQLDVTNLLVGLSGPVWSADRLRIVRGRDENIIRARHVNLSDVTALVTELNEDHVWLKRWTALKPAGLLEHIKVQVTGPWDNPEDFSIAANIKELSVRPYDKYPGVERLSAHLVVGRDAGELKLNAMDPVLLMPQLFRGPLAARRVNGVVQWEKTADHWRVTSDDLHLQSDDGIANGSLDLHIPFDTAVSPYLKVQADFRDGNGAHAARYFPVKRLKPKTLAWMESAFVSGRIVSGQLIFDGPVRDFPFDEAPGKFEIRGHVRDGVYRYLRGWRPISEAEVDVAINGEMVLITGHGKIGDLNVKDVSVAVRPPSDGKARTVYIRGRLHGPVDEAITVLREARSEESAKWAPYLPADLQGMGEGQLALEVDLPVATPRKPVLRGLYSFANAGFMLTDLRLVADTLAGQIRFTQRGLEEGEVRGRFQGGDMLFSAERGTNGLLRIHSSGRLESPKLLAARPKIAQAVSGSVDWSVSWRERIGLGDLYIATDLRDIKASLPSPLARPRGLGLGKLFIQTETSRPDLQTLVIKGGDAIRGRLTFARTKSVWGFTRGHINLGWPRANVPQGLGLAVNADMDTLDVDRWLPLLGEDAGVRATSKVLTRLSADIRRLNMFNRQFGRASIDIMRAADGWRGIVDGDAATGSGAVSMASGKPMLIQLDLARLSLPDKENRGTDTAVEVTKLPAVEVRSKYFIVKDKQLGELDFAAVPGPQGWRIKRFNLTRPDMTLAVNGWWRVISGRHTSDFNIAFNSSDMGKTLAAFGMPDQVAGGEVEIKSLLSWAGSPANPRLAALNGNIDIVAEKGRFVRVASGAGRLFGLLDLRSIGRYLTLDFSPIFGKGFIYDRISGQVTIERGNAYTNDLLIKGPSAEMEVDGRVGLAAEDFDLTLGVNPKLSNTLTLTSWGLFGPGVAAAVFAFQKIFRKQIAEGTRVTYIVKGPWDTPAITRLARPRAAEDNASTPGEASTP